MNTGPLSCSLHCALSGSCSVYQIQQFGHNWRFPQLIGVACKTAQSMLPLKQHGNVSLKLSSARRFSEEALKELLNFCDMQIPVKKVCLKKTRMKILLRQLASTFLKVNCCRIKTINYRPYLTTRVLSVPLSFLLGLLFCLFFLPRKRCQAGLQVMSQKWMRCTWSHVINKSSSARTDMLVLM